MSALPTTGTAAASATLPAVTRPTTHDAGLVVEFVLDEFYGSSTGHQSRAEVVVIQTVSFGNGSIMAASAAAFRRCNRLRITQRTLGLEGYVLKPFAYALLFGLGLVVVVVVAVAADVFLLLQLSLAVGTILAADDTTPASSTVLLFDQATRAAAFVSVGGTTVAATPDTRHSARGSQRVSVVFLWDPDQVRGEFFGSHLVLCNRYHLSNLS